MVLHIPLLRICIYMLAIAVTSANVSSPNYSIGNDQLSNTKRPFVSKEDNLLFTSNLSWNEHYNYTLRQSISVTKSHQTHSTTWLIYIQTKKALYLSLVHSHLSYCSQVWRPFKLKDIRIGLKKSN